MKKLFLLLLVLTLVAAASIVWFYINVQPAGTNKNFKNFLIEKGASASKIGTNLEQAGFIKNALAFKIYVKFSGQDGKIFPGEYRLNSAMSMFQIVSQLTRGPLELWVTIPEGLRREEVAMRFTTGLDRDAVFTNEFLQASKNYEGKLFPDTYLFPKDASASSIVNKMTKTFDSKTSGLVAGPDLTFNQRIVLASILERETKTSAERPIVAGIMMNRIRAGMPLQVDAAVQYAVGTSKNWWPILSRDDLQINSPFNTYKFSGLPPAPIASPGISALEAAFSPASTEYWYYIHDKSGIIHYAGTLQEHNANVAKYLGK
ncbi:MAG: endolytic transglycosylase MltG [Candidatus Woesebacteria bacterium]|nr:MAG: endolytic transglycosylase MltG [Candidatus Woesebacteria bacterium]